MKIKILSVLALCLLCSLATDAQNRFLTKEGYASFFSSAPLEDIEAHNYQVIIIGGGLAGLCNAIHLTLAGLRVLLIEKQQYPKHKVCSLLANN